MTRRVISLAWFGLSLALLPSGAAACPANSVWLGDDLSGSQKTRHCQCFPGYTPKGDQVCSPITSGADFRRLPDKAMRLISEAFGLGLPDVSLTANALRERIAKADPFEPEAQQALSFVDGFEFMERVRRKTGIKPGQQPDPSRLADAWQEVMYDEVNSVFGPQREEKPKWLHWMLVSRAQLVEQALEEAKYDLANSEAYARERLDQPPPGPRANAHRFLQGMLLYVSGR